MKGCLTHLPECVLTLKMSGAIGVSPLENFLSFSWRIWGAEMGGDAGMTTQFFPSREEVGMTVFHVDFLSSYLIQWSQDRDPTTSARNRNNSYARNCNYF